MLTWMCWFRIRQNQEKIILFCFGVTTWATTPGSDSDNRAILYIWIITPSLMKLLTSPLAIVLAAKKSCLSALEEPGNRGVIILGGSLWERPWFSGDRTQNCKTKKKKPEGVKSQHHGSQQGWGLIPIFSLVLTNSKKKEISETSVWDQLGLEVHVN